jgi:hypothetical protein
MLIFRSSLRSIRIHASVTDVRLLSFGLCYSLRLIAILRWVDVLSEFGFRHSGVQIVTFEPGSVLKRLEAFGFCKTILKSIPLPSEVDLISRSALADNGLGCIAGRQGNSRFLEHENIFVSRRDPIAVWYFGGCNDATLGKHIKAAREMRFCNREVSRLHFGSRSMLPLLERRCFEPSSVRSIIIPSSAEVFEESRFRKAEIQRLAFEKGRPLGRVESECFAGCSMMILFPASLERLATFCLRCATIEKLWGVRELFILILSGREQTRPIGNQAKLMHVVTIWDFRSKRWRRCLRCKL